MLESRRSASRCAALVIGLVLAVLPGSVRADATATIRTQISNISSSGWGCGDALPIYYSGTWNATYTDNLPPGAKITNVKVLVRMGASSGVSSTPTVSAALNGVALGGYGVGSSSCPFRSNLPQYTYEQSFSAPFQPYNVRGTNTLSLTVAATCFASYNGRCGVTIADPVGAMNGLEGATIVLTYTTGIETFVSSGDGSTGSVSGPVELVARAVKYDTTTVLEGKTINFKVTTVPLKATGTAVGATESATSTTYAATVDASGLARATLLLGNKDGTYQVEAISPLTQTNTPARFTVTAKTPASIRIGRRDETINDEVYRDTHVVLPLQDAKFRAIGFDAAGQRIGPVRCNWKTVVAKNATNPGSATLAPTLLSSSTAVSPTAFGLLALEGAASPSIGGLAAGRTNLNISSGLFVHVEGAFNPANPVDHLPQYVPGASLNGTNVPLPGTNALPQRVTLHVLTPPNTAGTLRFELTEVSRYPGVAMNWPSTGAVTDDDLYFLDGSGTRVLTIPSMPFAASGDNAVTLHVNDYAANGRLRVVVSPSGKTPFAIGPVRIPADADGNSLPDAGWTAVGTVSISSAGLTATGDVDPADGAVGTDAAVTGDGLSAFEELRGFSVAGGYVRLNPRRKEIFVHIDPDFLLSSSASPLQMLTTLRGHLLYLEPNEVQGTDHATRQLQRASAVVNFNRQTVPVAHSNPQRAVRVVYQDAYPPAVYIPEIDDYRPVWTIGILGATLSDDVLDIDVLNAPGNVATIQTPMRTQLSELYVRTFTNLAVRSSFTYPQHYDANGNVVPQCTFQGQANCDVWDTAHQLILPSRQPGGWAELYTVPSPQYDPTEHYTAHAFRCSDDTYVVGGLNESDWERLKGFLTAHEMGHALSMAHLTNRTADCGDLMFDTEGTPAARRAMSNSLPQPTEFSDKDEAMMRLWQP